MLNICKFKNVFSIMYFQPDDIVFTVSTYYTHKCLITIWDEQRSIILYLFRCIPP